MIVFVAAFLTGLLSTLEVDTTFATAMGYDAACAASWRV